MTFPLAVSEFPDHVVSQTTFIGTQTSATTIGSRTVVLFHAIYPTVIDAIDLTGALPTVDHTINFYRIAAGAAISATTTLVGTVTSTAGATQQTVSAALSAVDESTRLLQRGERLAMQIIAASSTASLTDLSASVLGRTKRA